MVENVRLQTQHMLSFNRLLQRSITATQNIVILAFCFFGQKRDLFKIFGKVDDFRDKASQTREVCILSRVSNMRNDSSLVNSIWLISKFKIAFSLPLRDELNPSIWIVVENDWDLRIENKSKEVEVKVFIKLGNKGHLLIADDNKRSNNLDYSKRKKGKLAIWTTNYWWFQHLFFLNWTGSSQFIIGWKFNGLSSSGPITILACQPGLTVNYPDDPVKVLGQVWFRPCLGRV